MRKRVALIVMLFMIISVFVLNCGHPVREISERDGVIEWQIYSRQC